MEDHAVDLFYWFDKSSKRKSVLKEHFEFCDSEYQEVIKLISTRWLCLEMCVNRELKKYAGLKSYFLSQKFPDARFKRLKKAFSDPMLEVYLLFYQSVLPIFTNFNKYLQREEPLIYKLSDAQNRFMNKLVSKFVKHKVIQVNKMEQVSIVQLNIELESQKKDLDLGVGILTKEMIKYLTVIFRMMSDKFFDGVRSFYLKAYRYCVKWLPLD